mgnify:CR=1 FL=1
MNLGVWECGAKRNPFRQMGNEEHLATGGRQHRADALGAQAVSVRLDHGCRRNAAQLVNKRAVIALDGIQVDVQNGASHGLRDGCSDHGPE